jgi:hypothetical protein
LEKHPQLVAAREHPFDTSLRALHYLVFSTCCHPLPLKCARQSLGARGRRADEKTRKGCEVS